MNPQNKSVTLLFNPFFYVAGIKALGFGLAAIFLAGLVGSWGHVHFDGVLDSRVGAAAPFWSFLAEGMIDWLCLFLVLWICGKITSQSAFRAVDLLGTQALARWPALFMALLALSRAFQRFSAHLADLFLKPATKTVFSPLDETIIVLVVLGMILLSCWMVALMYKSFSVCCNVKGGKAIGTFIAGLVVAEALSKVCVVLICHHAGIIRATAAESTASAPAAIVPALQPVEQTADLSAAGAQFVDLVVKGDFAGAVGRFDSTMKNALPEQKLQEAWQSIQEQAGPFKRRLRARTETVAGYDVVFVTCQFARAELDAKVVFGTNKQIAGLFFVPSQPEAKAAELPSYVKPSAFREEEFSVGSGEWSLPGTLTLPVGITGLLPAVVLVHGSGPNDRDETILANKPFRDLAWGLASKGIAVLRYEKRTKEHAAKIVAAGVSQFTVKEETIDDALSAAAQLRRTSGMDPKRIFILGHSLGGTVAPRIGQADPSLAGLIILAGATRPLEDLMVEQSRYMLTLGGKPPEEDQAKLNELIGEVAKVKRLTAADASSSVLLLHAPPQYWLDLREHEPLAAAKTLRLPVLILQGERDYQVTQADFAGWKSALGLQPGVTFKLYPDLNHLFMAGDGKSTPAEYERPGHVAESVIGDIAKWILIANRLHKVRRMNMTREEIEACRKDPRNRKWGFYYCKADPRVIVPRGLKWMGWTVNAAHLSAIPVLLLLIAIFVVPVRIVQAAGAGSGVELITGIASITVVCLVCAYLSSRTK